MHNVLQGAFPVDAYDWALLLAMPVMGTLGYIVAKWYRHLSGRR